MTGRGCNLKGKPSKQICEPEGKIQTKSHPKSSAPDCTINHQLEIMNLELGCHYNPLRKTGWAGFNSLCAVWAEPSEHTAVTEYLGKQGESGV